MAKPSHPRLADHLASFGREPEAQSAKPAENMQKLSKRPGTEVDLSQFGLNR